MTKTLKWMGAAGLSLFAALPAFAQEVASTVAAAAPAADGPIKAPTVEQMAGMVDKGDTTWMLISSALVLLMSVPALALFYGGLVRTKNMLSLLMQVFMIVSVAALVWVSYGYSLAFTSGGPFIGGFSKAFLAGVDATTYAATFSNNVYIPEYAFVVFQMTFACITPALIVGAFAERIKFTPLIIFTVLWLTLAYFPIAHMVWYWAGPDFLADTVQKAADGSIISQDAGYLWGMGALDFAGGTVVHINAGIAGLVGCLIVGKRLGYGKEAQPDDDNDRRFAFVGGLVRL
jgi:ammonium transporter, Amt family